MPHSISAAKRVRQNQKRNLKNKFATSAMKTYIKKVLTAVEKGDAEAAKANLKIAMSKIDKAAKASAIHKNAASRQKSRISRAIARLSK